jgi:2-polyprenyl-6-methoxyphenol hydroxylase-like FAD-dependent oxidoreductase
MTGADGVRVLVAGAGIGGLSAGIALAQRGIEVEVVEAKPVDMPMGVGLVLPANALRGLGELGVLDECMAAGVPFDRNRFCEPDGRLVVEVPARIGHRDGLPSLAVHRAELHRVLLGAAKEAGVPIAYGTTVSGVTSDGDGAHVRLSRGRTATYDLVVGFDGINSALRRHVTWPTAAQPHHTGFATWRVSVPRAPEIRCGTLFMGVGNKAGLNPLSQDEMYLFATTREPVGTRLDRRLLHEILRERLAGYGGLVAEVLAGLTGPQGIVYSPVEEMRLPAWHRGRVLVAGDAAHATAPQLTQGAAMAVEDAVVLARLLAAAGPKPAAGPVSAVPGRFMDARRGRCAFVQDTSKRILLAETATDAVSVANRLDRIRELPARTAAIDAVLSRPAW